MREASWERNSAVITSGGKSRRGGREKNGEGKRRSKYKVTAQPITGAGFSVKDDPSQVSACTRKRNVTNDVYR